MLCISCKTCIKECSLTPPIEERNNSSVIDFGTAVEMYNHVLGARVGCIINYTCYMCVSLCIEEICFCSNIHLYCCAMLNYEVSVYDSEMR